MVQSPDIAIARAARLRPIAEVATAIGIAEQALHPFGHHIAKVRIGSEGTPEPRGRLVLVTGMSPTPAGEGKTTTTVGLADALRRLGLRAAACLREPSLGPCFGVKGGAAGGGYAQVVPMEEINLHFTGDFHAVAAAHNLLAALIDNHLYWGNGVGLDPRRITWRRALDMNDRALRQLVIGLGGAANGFPREDGFDITAASEVMAVLCLARDLADLKRRLGRIIVGHRRDGSAVTAADLKADGAMAALLRDAFNPNLVQTLEGTPAFVHGGPFANIAHGCNSAIATRLALAHADVVVTEAGFGADLGAEKFLHIKCRQAGIAPDCAVIVATVRALKMHGGVAKAALGREDVAAIRRGAANLRRHIGNMRLFGVPVVVCVNRFANDTPAEIAAVADAAAAEGAEAHPCTHWSDGSAGAMPLARAVAARLGAAAPSFTPIYPREMPLAEKIRTIATRLYRAAEVAIAPAAASRLAAFEAAGFGHLPVCVAKTPYSFSADPTLLGAPEGHVLPVREVRLAAGAEFVVALAGEIMTMPGLPRVPAAEAITLDDAGEIEGLS
ncbi:formate--tetrahydrofolate ligase [Elioraea sp. Yellowstone]|jgi:formate--tetrahydrofolate ligase|uniref:formate--tetrahydrofolate ligase n=1 Tax=Elioraea sp. Yellowstone TaxID=2592070 RepID=UPI00115026B9|nr:formate--tetrahydrofolate ligase [Elioraea sp. Yellowstone]TQF77320.1 formate--tetrahydrofolate ligase [Elioraea sp. Yellowstone]